MGTKYEEGDLVRLDNGQIGQITSIIDEGCYIVNEYILCTDAHLKEKVDKKTAFLTELKELMEKYGVKAMQDSGMYEIEGMEILFEDDSRILFPSDITPSNIFDYDK